MTPEDRIRAYFVACGEGSAAEIASHFTSDAVIYDTNIKPVRGADEIAAMWIKVRERWGGAKWSVDSIVALGPHAAIEWSMTGSDPANGRAFTFRGSEHYRMVEGRVDEIRQYWTFHADILDTALVGFDYEPALG